MYKYCIFGLNVLSDVDLGGYRGHFEEADVVVCRDESLCEISDKSQYICVNSKELTFSVDAKALFSITNGNRIAYKMTDDCEIKMIELYVLGTSFGAIMIQRGDYPLHGASLYKKGKGICIVGDSGAGKSSLGAGLGTCQWKTLTDDVIRLTMNEEDAYINPSYPSMKLWDGTAEALGIDVTNLRSVIDRENKYYYKGEDIFKKDVAQLNYVFELVKADVTQVSIERMSTSQLLETLMKNTYRDFLVTFSNKGVDHFRYMAKVCKNIKGYRITRPLDGFSVPMQIKEIETIIGENNENI